MTPEDLKKMTAIINAIEDPAVLRKRMADLRSLGNIAEDACDRAPLLLACYGPQGFLAYTGVPYAVYMEKAREVRADFRQMMMVAEARLVVLRADHSAAAPN